MPAKVLLATRNAKKLAELQRILATRSPTCEVDRARRRRCRTPDVPETGADLRGQRAGSRRARRPGAPGCRPSPTTRGLAVDALNGMPGVLRARWAGRHGDDAANLELLLGQIADVPDERRGAAFVCAAAARRCPDGRQLVVEGRMHGPAGARAARHERLRLRPDLRRRTADP